MDNFRHLVAAPRTRRALLNDTMRALPTLFGGRGVTQLAFDPEAIARLRATGLRLRTLLHPSLPGDKK